MARSMLLAGVLLASPLLGGAAAAPQLTTFGSSGAHGALVVAPGEVRVIDLGAVGTYDADRWAVRFDYTSVTVGAGAVVRFVNHPSRAPVAWVVAGDVVLASGAVIDVDGAAGEPGTAAGGETAEPGPGGFRGGRSSFLGAYDNASGGFGAGAARNDATDAQYAGAGASHVVGGAVGAQSSTFAASLLGAPYGARDLAQLVGGSGGGAGRRNGAAGALSGGGGGGGALLVAADGEIRIAGRIDASGGAGGPAGASGAAGGGGSGGAVRLASLERVLFEPGAVIDVAGGAGGTGIADAVSPGGAGALGRIRVEAPGGAQGALGLVPQTATIGTPQAAFQTQAPRVWVASVGGQPAPAFAALQAGHGGSETTDLAFDASASSVTVVVETTGVPEGSEIYLRVARTRGSAHEEHGPLVLGPGPSATFAAVALPPGVSVLEARAVVSKP